MTVCEAVDRTLIYRHLLRAVLRAPGGEIPPGGLVILLRSERAARRVMESMTDLLEETLVLPVNRDKSHVAPSKARSSRLPDSAREHTDQHQDTATLQESGRDLTRRNNGLSMIQAIRDLSEYLRGWVSYFASESSARCSRTWMASSAAVRSMQLKKWKKPGRFQRMMIRAGYPVDEAKRIWLRMNTRQSVARVPVRLSSTWIGFAAGDLP